ncbi:MAG: DUF4190 domain-containing protein [Planctomycetes bacterium]|nr:DUF4190 domain-containing protein [Planctomycetota bacterium]
MAIELSCACGHRMRVKDELGGKKIRCPKCAAPIVVQSAAVPVSSHDPATKACPVCGEPILATASKCKHCGEYLSGAPRPAAIAAPPVAPRTSGMAVASLVLGILGAPTCIYGTVFQILAMVFGIIALKQIDASRGQIEGRGMALWGRGLGFVGLGVWVGLLVVLLISGGLSK